MGQYYPLDYLRLLIEPIDYGYVYGEGLGLGIGFKVKHASPSFLETVYVGERGEGYFSNQGPDK